MEIIMKPGFELTEEIKQMAKYFDHNYRYIENYGQMKEQEYKNDDIMEKLKPLGVERIW